MLCGGSTSSFPRRGIAVSIADSWPAVASMSANRGRGPRRGQPPVAVQESGHFLDRLDREETPANFQRGFLRSC